MSKPALSVVMPSVNPLEKSVVYQSFLESGVAERLAVQFVYLRNFKKVPEGQNESRIEDRGSHEVIHIASDRYFGSCEENLFRVQDVLGLLKPHLFCVGEHDWVDWKAVEGALAFATEKQLEALSWNITSRQMKTEDSYTEQVTVIPLAENIHSNRYVQAMIGGEVFDSTIAFPALVSFYGPVDWMAYIGNHLFTHALFTRLMQYRFSEHIYSLVYKMASYLCRYPVRYGFYNTPVVYRISDEFMKMGSSVHAMGWLGEHRLVHGNCATPWLPILLHLYELEDEALFNVMVNGLCLACEATPTGEQKYGRNAMLAHTLWWGQHTLTHKLTGRSYYLPEATGRGGMQDIRYLKLFYGKLQAMMSKYPAVYQAFGAPLREALAQCVIYLDHYLATLNAGDDLLAAALERLAFLQANLTPETVMAINQMSFAHYTMQSRAAA